MIAVLFGTFNSRHAANALLADDLRRAGVELRLCHEPLWEETRDKHAPYFAPLGLARLALRYLGAALRLARRFPRAAHGAELAVVGFNGQLDVLLLRLLARGRKVLFAPLVTISETLVEDRRTYAPGSLGARLLAWLDRVSLLAADLVLLDTWAHRQWVARRLEIAPERIAVGYLGAEPQFAPQEPAEAGDGGAHTARADGPHRTAPLRVLFYGQYLPLHGALVIARAARLVGGDAEIAFELIGTGPERPACDALLADLAHVRRLDWVPYAELPARIRAADVVLGIFGASEKARMVVPNKVYQAAQVGRAIVTADTPAIREVFVPGESIVAIPPEPAALAEALRALAGDAQRRARLGQAAREAVARVAGPEVRAARLAELLRHGAC